MAFSDKLLQKQRAKLFAVQQEYGILLRQTNVDAALPRDAYLFLRVPQSIQLRAGDRTSSETRCEIISHTSSMPDQLPTMFSHAWRLAETDEAKSNLKAERVLAETREGLKLLHVPCTAHKIHTAARKTMDLPQVSGLLSGIVHTLKSLWDEKALKAWRLAVKEAVDRQLVILDSETGLSMGALQYRNNVLDMFGPSKAHPRQHAIVKHISEQLLNGDWRKAGLLEHRCSGCCAGRADAVQKIREALWRCMRGLKRAMLSKDNWREWPHPLQLFGLFGRLHSFLGPVLMHAFSRSPAEAELEVEGVEVDEENLEVWELQRRDASKSLRKAMAFLETGWEQQLYLFRGCIDPQVKLMASSLHMDSDQHEVSEAHKLLTEGRHGFNIVALSEGTHTHEMLRASLSQLTSTTLWEMPSTEALRSDMLLLCCRPAAYVWQSLVVRMECLPFKLFSLLTRCTPEFAQELLDTPHCQTDSFSASFLQMYDTPQALLGEEAKQVLNAAASLLRATKFSTERVHSRNRRRAHLRVQTVRMDVSTLALPHAAEAGLTWWRLQKAKLRGKGERLGRPCKRKRATCHDPAADAAQPQTKTKKAKKKRRVIACKVAGQRGGGGHGELTFMNNALASA